MGKRKYTARRRALAVREAFEETALSLSLTLSSRALKKLGLRELIESRMIIILNLHGGQNLFDVRGTFHRGHLLLVRLGAHFLPVRFNFSVFTD